MSREDYIKYFTHMQDEDQKCMLGGMLGTISVGISTEQLMRINVLQEMN